MSNELQIAETILEQLGGIRRLAMMAGCSNFVGSQEEKFVQFSIGCGAKDGINKMRVTLNSRDEYDVQFGRLDLEDFDNPYTVISEFKGAQADNLMDLFESETGMFLTFSPRR